jgi:hypothetical protein
MAAVLTLVAEVKSITTSPKTTTSLVSSLEHTMPEFIYSRGARRSAAPTYTAWTPPQSAAAISQGALQQLLRQPMQAQRENPRMSQTADSSGPSSSNQSTQMAGFSPETFQQMMRDAMQSRLDNVQQGNNTDMDGISNPNAGPINPNVAGVLRFTTRLGLMGLLGPAGPALFNAVDQNSPKPLAMAAINEAIPGGANVGLLRTLLKAFGVDPAKEITDGVTSALTASPTATPQPGQVGSMSPGMDAATQQAMRDYGWSEAWGWGSEATGANFSDRGPGGSSGTTDDGEGSMFNGGGMTGSSNGGQGGPRGGTSFGGGEY